MPGLTVLFSAKIAILATGRGSIASRRILVPRAHGMPPYTRGIDIDGNVNSWGLLWKLLSGSRIPRVQSPRYQWYHHRLKPWVHLVPIQADLSDLYEQLTWCSNHRQECAAIASAGHL